MNKVILTLNTGSSSIKFALYSKSNDIIQPIINGKISGIPNNIYFSVNETENIALKSSRQTDAFKFSLNFLMGWIKENFPDIEILSVGHRVVHGGERYSRATIIDQEALKYLEALISLAPLHQPHNLAGIYAIQQLYQNLPQVACFDTAFHATQPNIARMFAIPKNLSAEGIKRYGFHGLSYQYITEKLAELMPEKAKGKVIVAHLGHGASMCAIKDQQSTATTMGFTALDGLPMGTRSGTIDPGIILYLMNEKGYSLPQVEKLLYEQSGLLGISGISSDFRELSASNTKDASTAIEFLCYRIQRELGSLIAALEGLDVLVFTGGIGENSALVREKVCESFTWFGMIIDKELNESACNFKVSDITSKVDILVIPTNEELIIAKNVFRLM